MKMPTHDNFHPINHPLIDNKMARIRQKKTPPKEFRELFNAVTSLLAFEATKGLPLDDISIETPLATTNAKILTESQVVLVPILRAGLGMVDAMISLIPNARVRHIGLERDPKTHLPRSSYFKPPNHPENRHYFLLDPMLGTAGSAISAVEHLKAANAKNIRFMCILACPEGINNFCNAHPDVPLYAAAVDEVLNSNKYIVPGLGDAGDRLYGTD